MIGTRQVFAGTDALARGAAETITGFLAEALRKDSTASLVLSGGRTPRNVYAQMESGPLRGRLDWSRLHLFWGDERCVPPSSPESNYGMARETLLARVPVPPENVHRIEGEIEPRTAAAAYEQEIRTVFSLKDGELPVFTVLLLGLGGDGHTASLFPGTAALAERRRLVIDVHAPAVPADRITLTLPVINNARHILFLVEGKEKAAIVRRVTGDPRAGFPAQLVVPGSGTLTWLLESGAASALPQS